MPKTQIKPWNKKAFWRQPIRWCHMKMRLSFWISSLSESITLFFQSFFVLRAMFAWSTANELTHYWSTKRIIPMYLPRTGTFYWRYRICRNKRPIRNKRSQKTVIFQRGEYTKPMGCDGWFFKGGSTQNRWVVMGDFSKGGVHKTDGLWWVIFQRGEYTKPMGCDGWFFKGGSTQNRWVVMGDFSKGGVHKTDGLWWVIFQRGEYIKPMGCDGWFFKEGSTQTDGFWRVFYFFEKLSARGVYFGKYGITRG